MKKFMCVILAVITVCTVVGITGCNGGYKTYLEAREQENSSSASSSSGGVSDSTMIWLYCRASDIRVTHSGSYTICTGKVTNTNSTYAFRFVKVKGEFKNSSGRVIDTDGTYAVGSEWLNPGASTSFRLSVPKDISISTCSVTVYG